MATGTEKFNADQNTSDEKNPSKTVEASDPLKQPPSTGSTDPKEEVDGSKGCGDAPSTGAVVGATTGNSEPVSSILKKIKRAERFGMPVQLSEAEKRNSRAERFGTGSNSQGADAIKKSEDLKRKARAERFGLASESAAEEEAKKKARGARFTLGSKADTAEEDKRKARALRFGNPSSSSLSNANGKRNIEANAAIAGKAGGAA